MQKEMREINFRNLIWKIIFAWKTVLLGAVLGTIVFIGLGYILDGDKTNTSNINNSTQVILNETQKANANKLLELYDQLNYYEQYIEESLLIKVNPLCYNAIKLQYYVDSEYVMNLQNGSEGDYTAALVSAYASFITSDVFIDEIKSLLGIELANNYIRELFSVEYDIESSVIEIEAVVPNNTDTSLMMTNMRNVIQGKAAALQEIGKHQLKEINASIDEMTSDEMVTNRSTIVRALDSVKLSIETTKAELSLEELVYVDQNLAYDQYKGGYVINAQETEIINKKYAVVGFVLGVFCVIGYYVLKVILSNKLQDDKDIRQLFGIKLLGMIEIRSERIGPVQHLLCKIKNRHEKVYSFQEQLDRMIVGIDILCKKNSISKVFISGCCLHKISDEFLEELKQALSNINIQVIGFGKIDTEAYALDMASKADGVMLLEKMECSVYEQIEQEIIVASDYNIPMLGTIVIKA